MTNPPDRRHSELQSGVRAPIAARGSRRWSWVGAALLIVAGGWGWWLWSRPLPPRERALQLLSQAQHAADARRLDLAEQAAAEALQLDPTLVDAAFVAAESAAAAGKYDAALGHLERLDSADADVRLMSAVNRGEWNYRQFNRLSAAEAAYHAALELQPDHPQANAGLAELLAICGRRREAIPHVLRLIRLGVETELLILLAWEDGALNRREQLADARRADPQDPAPLIGLAWHDDVAGDHAAAVERLREALQSSPDHPAAWTALGRQYVKLGRYDQLADLLSHPPAQARDWAETWLLRAELAEQQKDRRGATRCYWEASVRAPELKVPVVRLSQWLAEAGRPEAAAAFAERLKVLLDLGSAQDRMLTTPQHASVDPAVELALACERAGRIWEASGWSALAANVDHENSAAREMLSRHRSAWSSLPLELTIPEANVARQFDLSDFPLPTQTAGSTPTTPAIPITSSQLEFRDLATDVGLLFRYHNGTLGEPTRRMFEFTGGGIGVLDFDRDAWPDVACIQGCPWPPGSTAALPGDVLFRNCAGRRFSDITEATRISESDFGQGVACGDVDADGFPDLFVANIGPNRLWLNQGDGTFVDVTPTAGVAGDDWSTSSLMADLDGDGLTDIYSVSYLTGDDVYERVCRHADGSPVQCLPVHFDGGLDRYWRNLGDGRFADVTADRLSPPPNGKGLGCVAWDAGGDGRISLFVANDTTANLFYRPEDDPASDRRMIECGILSGLAVNAAGKAEGSMGIALGDVDDNGWLDVHVTNFLNESNTLYLAEPDYAFRDATREAGLVEPTLGQLGFGTQFLDADLDGSLELFVSNGHVDDLRRYGKPYAMPPQMFRCRGGACVEIAAADLGNYFNGQWLGRAATQLDWNRDGRPDLAVSHLDAPAALLENATPAVGRSINLQLVATNGARDAVGATVTVRCGKRTITRQLAAGEGYLSSNERRVVVGLDPQAVVSELSIRWPGGATQSFTAPPFDQELLAIEGEPLLPLPPSHPAEPGRMQGAN